MWTPNYIRLENFKSHRKTVYDFNNGKTTIVYGQNHSAENPKEESNGTGKSSLLDAIVVALLDIPDREIAFEDYIKDGEKEALLVFELNNSMTKETMKIERFLHRNKSNSVRLYFNDVLDDQITGLPDGNAKVLEKLEISKEDLLNFYLIRQKQMTSFFMATDTRKKNIIGRFCAEKQIASVIESVEADLLVVQDEIDGIRDDISVNNTKVETHEESILELEEEAQNDNTELIKEKRERIDELKEEIEDYKAKIKASNDSLDKLIDQREKKNFENKIKKSRFALSKKEEQKAEFAEVLSYLTGVLTGVVECPKCNHRFNPSEDVDVNEAEALKAKTLDEQSSLKYDISTLESKIDKLKGEKEEFEEEISKIKRTLRRMESEHDDSESRIKRLEKAIINLMEGGEVDNTEQISKLRSKISELNRATKQLEKLLDQKLEEWSEINELKDSFGLKGFYTYLINKTLGGIERNVNIQLRDFDTDLAVKIEGYKTLKSGETREKIDVAITKDGVSFHNFKRFSGGQRARVDLAGILVFQQIINDSCSNGGLDLLCLDEYMENLDLKGQRMIVPLLENTGITTMVVSHMNYDVGFEYELWLDYDNDETIIRL